MVVLEGGRFVMSEVPLYLPVNSTMRSTRVEREVFSDNLLVRIHRNIVMIRWTGLTLWEFAFLCRGI